MRKIEITGNGTIGPFKIADVTSGEGPEFSFIVDGTFGSGTVEFQVCGRSDGTFHTPADGSFTDNGGFVSKLRREMYFQIVTSGATDPDLVAVLA